MSLPWIAHAAAALGGLIALLGCDALGPAHARRPNVVLITVDTLRADHLGAYGDPKAETPALDRLAREGVRFAQVSASVPLTLPSHSSILTGRDPVSHGVRDNTSFRLPESERTLAEILAERGYQTAAVVGAVVLNGRFGLGQGFEHYDDLVVHTTQAPAQLQRRADAVTERALEWLRHGRRQGSKFFLWVHYFDPHKPYLPPPPYSARHAGAPYDGEIAFVDRWMGRLVEGLRKLDAERNTLLVITADHGEGLGAHDEETHGFFLYETTLRVPLIWWGPGVVPEGVVVDDPVRSIDILPTLLDLLGLPPKPDADGKSLVPLMDGSRETLALESYSEALTGKLAFDYSPLRSLRFGEWKYILAPRDELYRLTDDPGETSDLSRRFPRRKAELRARLLRRVREAAAKAPSEDPRLSVGTELSTRLERLGYLPEGSLQEQARHLDRDPEPAGEDMKDAKAMIHHIIRGERLRSQSQWDEAAAQYREALRLDPDNEHALTYLAKLYEQQGHLDAAIALFDRLEDAPTVTRPAQVLGKLYLEKGAWDRALEVFRRLAEREPHNVWAHYYMGEAYRSKGMRAEALRAFERAVRSEPALAEAHGELARAYLEAGQPERAVAEYQAAMARASSPPEVREGLTLGLLRLGRVRAAGAQAQSLLGTRPGSVATLVGLGARNASEDKLTSARALLQEALRRDADSFDGWYYLAVVQARSGEAAEAIGSLERSLALGGAPYRSLARKEEAFSGLADDPRLRRLLGDAI